MIGIMTVHQPSHNHIYHSSGSVWYICYDIHGRHKRGTAKRFGVNVDRLLHKCVLEIACAGAGFLLSGAIV